jgi:hypothetical protein
LKEIIPSQAKEQRQTRGTQCFRNVRDVQNLARGEFFALYAAYDFGKSCI